LVENRFVRDRDVHVVRRAPHALEFELACLAFRKGVNCSDSIALTRLIRQPPPKAKQTILKRVRSLMDQRAEPIVGDKPLAKHNRLLRREIGASHAVYKQA
jgi:hypothetical protein